MNKSKYGVFMKVKFSDCASWLNRSMLVHAINKYEAQQLAEQIYAIQEDCEWVRTDEVIEYK